MFVVDESTAALLACHSGGVPEIGFCARKTLSSVEVRCNLRTNTLLLKLIINLAILTLSLLIEWVSADVEIRVVSTTISTFDTQVGIRVIESFRRTLSTYSFDLNRSTIRTRHALVDICEI